MLNVQSMLLEDFCLDNCWTNAAPDLRLLLHGYNQLEYAWYSCILSTVHGLKNTRPDNENVITACQMLSPSV